MKNRFKNPDYNFGVRLCTLFKDRRHINLFDSKHVRNVASILVECFLYRDAWTGFDYSTQGKKKEALIRRIDDHVRQESADRISSRYITMYSQFLGCNSDYLLGITDSPSWEESYISEMTGLSEKASLYLLMDRRNEDRAFLSDILTSDFFNNLQLVLGEYATIKEIEKHQSPLVKKLASKVLLSPENYDPGKNYINNAISTLVDSLINDPVILGYFSMKTKE